MIFTRKISQTLLLVSIICSLFISCDLDEDESDCVANMELSFRYLKSDSKDYFGTDLSSLSVFVFDEHKNLVGRWDEYKSTLFDADYKMEITLLPGVYSFVVWGGLNTPDYVVVGGETKISRATEKLISSMGDDAVKVGYQRESYHGVESNVVNKQLEPLFYGSLLDSECKYGGDNSHTIDLLRDSKQINLTVIGLPPSHTRDGLYPHMDIDLSAYNGSCDFWNNLDMDGEKITYIQQNISIDQDNNHTSKLYSMRMIYGDEHKLTIYNKDSGREFYVADLLEDFIKKVPQYSTQEAIDAKDEFNITIDVRTPVAVEVTVDGWYVGVSGSVIQ